MYNLSHADINISKILVTTQLKELLFKQIMKENFLKQLLMTNT